METRSFHRVSTISKASLGPARLKMTCHIVLALAAHILKGPATVARIKLPTLMLREREKWRPTSLGHSFLSRVGGGSLGSVPSCLLLGLFQAFAFRACCISFLFSTTALCLIFGASRRLPGPHPGPHPGAAVTKVPKLGGLKTTETIFSVLEDRSPKSRCQQGASLVVQWLRIPLAMQGFF